MDKFTPEQIKWLQGLAKMVGGSLPNPAASVETTSNPLGFQKPQDLAARPADLKVGVTRGGARSEARPLLGDDSLKAAPDSENPKTPAGSEAPDDGTGLDKVSPRMREKFDKIRGHGRGVGDTSGGPTYGNVPLDEPGIHRGRVELYQENAKWAVRSGAVFPKGGTVRPSGKYNFVVVNGRIYASKELRHSALSQGGRVAWAGTIEFNNKNVLVRWDNSSGHYLPSSTIDINKTPPVHPALPWDKFVKTHTGPGPEGRGPQLPVIQPKPPEHPAKPGVDPKTPTGDPPKTPGGTTSGGKVAPPKANPPTTGPIFTRLQPALKVLGNLGTKFVGTTVRVGNTVKVPLFAALDVLTAIEFIEMTESAVRGEGFKFTKQIAQVESLGRDVSALIKAYKNSNLHQDLADMVAQARKIDAQDPDGLYGSDALSDYCVKAGTVVSQHKTDCEKLWDHLTSIESDVTARHNYANNLLNDRTFWVAIGVATRSSVIHAELFAATRDLQRILNTLYTAKYNLEPHLKIVRGDSGVIEANILERLPGITVVND